MSLRVVAGLALWLGLGALPVAHLGWKPSSIVALVLPLLLLFSARTGVLFALALLPLYLLRPDLVSTRSLGAPGALLGAALLLAYLIVAFREPLPRTRRAARRPAWSPAALLVLATATLCACALCVPYVPEVADALRRGYAGNPGAALTVLAIGCVALSAGLVIVYLAAPLDAQARERHP